MNAAPFIEIDNRPNLYAERDLVTQQVNLLSWRQYLMFRETLQPSRQVFNLLESIEWLLVENSQRLSPYERHTV